MHQNYTFSITYSVFQISKIYVWGIDMGNRYPKKNEHLFGPSHVMYKPCLILEGKHKLYCIISISLLDFA